MHEKELTLTMYEVTHFLSTQNKLGEGSLWSPEEQALYWVDIDNQRFFRFYPETRRYDTFDAGVSVGVMARRATGGLVMATRHGFATWDFQTNRLTYLVDPEAGLAHHRFNDGAIDCQGRFWAGTLVEQDPHPAEGVLYRLDPDDSVHVMETGLLVPNGMCWNADNTLMYLTDSDNFTIYVYDFDAAAGTIANRRPLISTQGQPGVPDGLAIDDEGFLWSAHWGGGKVIRYTPDGKVEREFPVPALHPTSCAFGGPARNELFITTAWTALSEEERKTYPLAGDLFHIVTDVTGTPRRTFAG